MTFFLQVVKDNLKKTKDFGKQNHAGFSESVSEWYTNSFLSLSKKVQPMGYRTMTELLQELSVLELDLVMQLTKQEIISQENAISETSLNRDEEKEMCS